MKRTRLFSVASWILVITTLIMVFSLAGCGKNKDDKVATLESENALLKEELETANTQLEQIENIGFQSFQLTAAAWVDAQGASVTFTGEPKAHQDGQTAQFIVRFNGEDRATQECTWDGKSYTAAVELEAADGYSYICVLTNPDGTLDQVVLSSPDAPTYDTLVYMQSSLTAYCNLFVADYEVKDDKMNITSGYVQVQLPQITSDGTSVEFDSAELEFLLNGEIQETQKLELPQGEGAGSYETALTSVSFKMPQMQDDYQLDLNLNVKLSNGSTITANGGSWFYNNNHLNMVVG